MSRLAQELEDLSVDVKRRLEQRGFRAPQLLNWAADLHRSLDEQNRIRGEVEPLGRDELAGLPPRDSDAFRALHARGCALLAEGKLAVCVLAGGMATRMGGVVKALVEVTRGQTFLDLRRGELEGLARIHGRALPMWLMTSEPTDAAIRRALGESDTAATFEQFVSLRLNAEGALFRDEHGEPSIYATGHGDLPDALRATALLDEFIAAGGAHVWISNIDNLGARVDPAILGQHAANGAPVTVEVCEKWKGDKGGGPVRHDGRSIICEHFRLPLGFDGDRVPVFNTNTFLIDAVALKELVLDWTYVRVEKTVGGVKATQFERLLGEITAGLGARFLEVSRKGPTSRFLPVKSYADLDAVRPTVDAWLDAR